ncbi:MAG: hypothetical protein K2L50_06780 [Bacteroidales bacterium]|nr:hypothetical protein [Bacteroidales bacterium]
MKKLVFACTLAAAFAFVACKSNKTAEPVVAAEETEVVAEAPASCTTPCCEGKEACDTAVCDKTCGKDGKCCTEMKAECKKACTEEGKAECKKACDEKAEAAE